MIFGIALFREKYIMKINENNIKELKMKLYD